MTKKTEIEENILPQEMHEALDERFVTYAQMSLEDRALPDARDGLKPSQRRVLIAMNDLNLTHRAATVKCAKICGDTSGNYHPHGEAVVYPTMYRLAQDWIMRQPLLIGQGNFGNVDGDPPAAMRYTEAKMSIFGDLMLEDLAPDVVPFVPNYDEKRTEPVILPAKFPNLLVNGCAGIAVGWATSMPPHNLREVVAVVKAWIKNPKITSEEIMAIMPGPDFPTGGKILGKGEILEYYSTGHANLKLEGGYKIERGTKRDRIIINELPYQVGPEKVAKEIEQLVEAKTIQGIADLKNLSSKKTGIQLVIECQTGANVNVIVNNILKHTSLRSSFSVNQTVLAGKKVYPDVNISFLVKTFVEHRVEILTKKFQAELQRAKARIHILDGLISAVSHIKKVIDIVLNSTDAVKELIDSKIVETEIQANAVLAITLRQLTKLEREKLTKEKDELEDRCKWLKKVLGHRDEILSLIVQEQEELAQKYGNDRRTKITASTKDIDNEDLIKDEDLIISLTGDGYIKSVPISTFKVQGRGGKGVQGVADAAEEDVFEIFQSRSKSTLFFFTNTGLCFKRKAYEVPQCSRTAKGMHVSNMLDLKEGEKVTNVISVDSLKEGFLVTLTAKGLIKRTELAEYETSLVKAGLVAIRLADKDEVLYVLKTSGKEDIVIVTKNGQCVRYNESTLSTQGRATQGSRAMKLAVDDEIAQMLTITPKEDVKLLVVTSGGFAKASHANEFKAFDNRQVKGYAVINKKALDKRGLIAGAVAIRDGKSLLMLTKKGKVVCIDSAGIRQTGRTTSGVMAARLDSDDEIIKIAAVDRPEDVKLDEEAE